MSSKLPQYNYFKLWQGIGLFLVAAVIYLSLTPKPPMIPLGIKWGDKLGHFLAYFVLMAWHAQLYHRFVTRVILIVAFIVMGIGLEFIQGMGHARMFEWADALANSVGAIVAFVASNSRMAFILQKFEQRMIA